MDTSTVSTRDIVDQSVTDARIAYVARLNDLRVVCGKPSYATLVRRSGFLRRSTIGDALSGRTFPSLEFVVEFVLVCSGHARDLGISVPDHSTRIEEWTAGWRRCQGSGIPSASDAKAVRPLTRDTIPFGGAERVVDSEPAAHTRADAPVTTVPRQLPADHALLVGRGPDLLKLEAATRRTTASGGPLVVVTGMGGVGKTSLVRRWAHEHRGEFPDGELWVDLNGFSGTTPTLPEHALVAVLRALGMDGAGLPADVEELAALFRSRTADAHLLVVLDNAADDQQVRPLLSASTRCTTVVTSRLALTGLKVVNGAHRITLKPLALGDAVELVREVTAANEIPAPEAQSCERLARLCGGLPLALRVVGERLTWDAADQLISELNIASGATRAGSTAALAVGTDQSVSAALTWSIERLNPQTRRFLRLTAIHATSRMSLHAAAALNDLPVEEARAHVRALVQCHLLEPVDQDHVRLHDLIRMTAAEDFARHEDAETRAQAQHRLVAFYCHTAARAERTYSPFVGRPAPPQLGYRFDIPTFADIAGALDWVTAEIDSILAVLDVESHDTDARAVWLAVHVSHYVIRGVPHTQALAIFERAEARAHACAELDAAGSLIIAEGIVLAALQRFDQAHAAYDRALLLGQQLGSDLMCATARVNKGHACIYQGAHHQGAEILQSLLTERIAETLPRVAAAAAIGLAEIAQDAGRHLEARAHIEAAIRGFEAAGDPASLPGCRIQLAAVESALGNHDTAIKLAEGVVRDSERHRDDLNLEEFLGRLAAMYQAAGMTDDAAGCRRRADDLHHHFRGSATASFDAGPPAR